MNQMLSLVLMMTLGGPPDAPPDDPALIPRELPAPVTRSNPLAERIDFVIVKPERVENGGDHWCPKCRSGQWTDTYRQADGWHSHKCGRCGTEFWHPNPAPQPMRRFRFATAGASRCSA